MRDTKKEKQARQRAQTELNILCGQAWSYYHLGPNKNKGVAAVQCKVERIDKSQHCWVLFRGTSVYEHRQYGYLLSDASAVMGFLQRPRGARLCQSSE